MSDRQREQLAMMLRTGMMDQEDYNETIAAMDVRDAGRAPAPSVDMDKDFRVQAEELSLSDEEHRKWSIAQGHNFSRRTGESLKGNLTYEEWYAQVDSKLLELGGFNLNHAKLMIPTLDMNRLFPPDQTNASTP